MKATTHIFLALVATLFSAGAIALSGCAAPPGHTATPKGGVLTSMGFALTDDGDPATPAGDLAATFDSPVVGIDDQLDAAGTAHATFDDGERDLASATVVGAFPDSDVVYAVLFDENEPWRYVIVAAHAGDVVAGADVALDGSNAAALVVDENTGSGFLSQSGSLHVDTVNLASGGRLAGSLSASLVEVGLASWPESLFPFTVSGDPSERAAATGSGTFDTGAGTATVSVDVAGHASFAGGAAYAEAADESDTVIVIESSDGGRSALAIFVENSALVAGSTVSLGGYVAGASLLEEDGSQIAFVDGTLTLDVVDGATISGSIALSGDAYVMPSDGGGDVVGEGEGEDCTGIDALSSTFAPAQVYIDNTTDGMPAGYDKALTFTDASNGMLGLLVPSDVDLHAGASYAFSSVDFEGRPYPAAVLGLATCSQLIEIESGVLTATLDDATGTLTGTLTYVVDGVSRDVSFAVPLVS